MNPKQTAYTDQQGGTVGLLSRPGIMIGREQLVNSRIRQKTPTEVDFKGKKSGFVLMNRT